MPDITITSENVKIVDASKTRHSIGNGSISIGDLVVLGGGAYDPVDIDTLASAPLDLDGSEYGIALNAITDADQPVSVAKSGAIVDFGSGVLVANTLYYGSISPGGITATPPATGDFGVIVGFAISTSQLALRFQGSGVATA